MRISTEDYVMLAEALKKATEIITSLGGGEFNTPTLSEKQQRELRIKRQLDKG